MISNVLNQRIIDDGDRGRASTLTILALFAIAMALLEAAVVVYMRQLYYPADPMELFPLAFLDSYDPRLELSREIATIVMIVTVALLVERKDWTRSFAAFVFVFGTWDLFYYVWLKVLMGWPRTWLEWDVLFLIPMIWLGPWICPALIALMFMVWGGRVLLSRQRLVLPLKGLAVFVVGAILGLIAFMQPAGAVMIAEGADWVDAMKQYTPNQFWWWLYGISLVLMGTGFWFTSVAIDSD
ncbi:MAG: hypothetical protein AAF456_24810 [Planctomycetota bacterium]